MVCAARVLTTQFQLSVLVTCTCRAVAYTVTVSVFVVSVVDARIPPLLPVTVPEPVVTLTACAPATPTPAFKLGEKSEDPLQMYLSDIFTISVNLAGLPAIALPCGFSKSGLPIGLQLIGRAFEEETVLRAAHAYEQATEWHLKKPSIR